MLALALVIISIICLVVLYISLRGQMYEDGFEFFHDYVVKSAVISVTFLLIVVIVTSYIYLPTTFVDKSCIFEKEDFSLTLWVKEPILQIDDDNSQPTIIVPINITNSGVQSIGSDNRKWNLILKTKNDFGIKLVEVSPHSPNLEVEEIEESSVDNVILQFGLFYPGESVDIQVELQSSGNNALRGIVAETNLPMQPIITITSKTPEIGSMTKYGSFICFGILIVLGLIYSIICFSYYHRDERLFDLDIVYTISGMWVAATFNAMAITELITLVQVLFS